MPLPVKTQHQAVLAGVVHLEVAAVPLSYTPAVAAQGTFIVQESKPMIAQRRGRDGFANVRRRRQAQVRKTAPFSSIRSQCNTGKSCWRMT